VAPFFFYSSQLRVVLACIYGKMCTIFIIIIGLSCSYMTSVPVRVLTQDLLDRNESCIAQAEQLCALSWEALCAQPAPGKWSAAECLQHLQKYHDYYVPLVQASLVDSNLWPTHDTVYRATWAGDWFATSMLANAEGKLKKMKSPYNKRPVLAGITATIPQDFMQQLVLLKELCGRADKYNLNKKCVAVAIFPLVKISVGDGLRLVIYHNQRHLAQALRAVQKD
jgi:hypothetical protein